MLFTRRDCALAGKYLRVDEHNLYSASAACLLRSAVLDLGFSDGPSRGSEFGNGAAITDPDMTSTAVPSRARDVLTVGPLQVSHRTMRLFLVLLPIWLVGAGDLVRFAWNTAVPGDRERTGLVKGQDFVQFYVAGSLAREGAWDALYDISTLKRAVARIVPAAAGLIPAPAYSPQTALLFSPLSKLRYLTARWVWFAASLLLYLIAASIVIRCIGPVRDHRVFMWMTILCNPLLSALLASGQIGVIAVVGWALAIWAFSRGRMWLFGVCIGLLIYKPTLLLGAVLVLMLLGRRRALTGLVFSAAAQVVVSIPATGIEPWKQYIAALGALRNYAVLTDTVPHQRHSLLGFFQLLPVSEYVAVLLYVVAVLGVLGLWLSKRREPPTLWFPTALATTVVLFSPHLYVYDLVVLVVPFLMAASLVARRAHPLSRVDRILLWSGFVVLLAPYSGAIALHARVQVSTLALMTLLVAVHRRAVEDTRSSADLRMTPAAAGAPQDGSDENRERQGHEG